MSYDKLTRDGDYVKSAIKQVGDQLLAVKDIKIVIPYHYLQAKLAIVESRISTICVFGIIVDNKYAVSNLCSTMVLSPSSTNIVTYNDEDFFEFEFSRGSVITPNINLVVDDINAFNIYSEFIAKGNVPWFLDYEDCSKILITAHNYAGINLAGNNIPLELIIGTIARSNKDLYTYYRSTLQTQQDLKTKPVVYVPFKSVSYGATSTAGKIMGSYFDEGLTSALTNDNNGSEGVEIVLRQ